MKEMITEFIGIICVTGVSLAAISAIKFIFEYIIALI